jgi:histidinol-phosphate aminotransferase
MSAPKTVIQPARPSQAWVESFLSHSITKTAPYKIDTPVVAIKLDQNESPWDLPPKLKQQILDKLAGYAWNRYPTAFGDEIAAKLASYLGVAPHAILLAPGSNYLISLVLTVFGKGFIKHPSEHRGGKLVIARPSFPLYESHCQYDGIPYETWDLDDDLEYDLSKLPKLTDGSMVIFASPNNPVGNVLPRKTLEGLLRAHPTTLFVGDEAYVEYASEPYTELLAQYPNLLLLRTFSKTMGAAGVRIGYVLGAPEYIEPLRKMRVPFLLNYFALACAEVLLEGQEMKDHLTQIQQNALRERSRVHAALAAEASRLGYAVKKSEANFLLVRWADHEKAQATYQHLVNTGILVRNVSRGPGLAGCLRVTLGNEQENDALIGCFRQLS